MKRFECRKDGCPNKSCRIEVEGDKVLDNLPCISSINKAFRTDPEWKEFFVEDSLKDEDELVSFWGLHVFDFPDCPSWAKFAARDKNDMGCYYREKPIYNDKDGWWVNRTKRDGDGFQWGWIANGSKFSDKIDWKESLLERPVKLEEGQWVKVEIVEETFVYGQFVKKDENGLYIVNSLNGELKAKEVIPIKVTPWDDNQLKSMIGEVFEGRCGVGIVQEVGVKDGVWLAHFSNMIVNAETLAKKLVFFDGEPCGNIKED